MALVLLLYLDIPRLTKVQIEIYGYHFTSMAPISLSLMSGKVNEMGHCFCQDQCFYFLIAPHVQKVM